MFKAGKPRSSRLIGALLRPHEMEAIVLATEQQREKAAKMRLAKSVSKGLTAERHKRPPTKRQVVYQRGLDMVEAVYGHSWRVIQHHLQQDNLRAALWVADHYLEMQGKTLRKPIEITEEMTAGEAAKVVMKQVFSGIISLEHGLQLMGLIERAAGLNYAKDIEELRAQIAAMASPSGIATNGPSPAWLRMKMATHEGNSPDLPAE